MVDRLMEIGLTDDVKEQLRQTQIEVVEERNKLKAILEAMDCGVTIRDRNYVLTYQNDYVTKAVGNHLGENCYRAFQDIDQICEGCPVEEAFDDGKTHRSTRRVPLPSGEVTYWENIANPIRNADGELVACIEINQDITHLKRAEEQRRGLEEQLWQAQKMEAIGQLAAGVAHDVNNLLCGISGLSSVIQERFKEGDSVFDDLAAIVAGCDRGHDLTQKLLAFGRKGRFKTDVVQPNRLITESVGLLERTLPKDIKLKLKLDGELPLIEVDQGQISHVVINLALNAVDAISGGGTVSISTTAIDITDDQGAFDGANGVIQAAETEPGSYVKIEVSDDGAGIDAETLKHVFEPFFTTKAADKGTGLGLSMVHGAVLAHNGNITIASIVGEGTTVTVLLPKAGEEDEIEAPAPTKTASPSADSKRRNTVLVVDDEIFVRLSAKRVLEELGYQVLLAENGAEAVEIFAARQDEVLFVLLDLMMPIMNGADAFKELRRLDPQAKILLASAYSAEGVDDLMEHGAIGFLRKPYTLKMIAKTIEDALNP